MARLPRPDVPGQPQHVIQRGNNREAIFCTDADYRYYLERLQGAAAKNGCEIHAYVLMTNHVHLLMTPSKKGEVGRAMQSLGRYYVQYFNHAYGRTGTLWEGRYRSTVIDTEKYLLMCMRYIELNPVRAGMVTHPSEYRWSSFHANALGWEDALVTPHEEYTRFGRQTGERQAAYQALFDHQLDSGTLDEIREATNKAWVLGNDRFREEIERKLSRRASPTSRGGDRRSAEFRRKQCFKRV